ncbi:vacuolar amino acid permease [Dendrothele bispora CBS 962.96]|uniref:Vacuolar amino acid permease n=1 Tax=Dendrothele bispora (strain CBS 962.96) TaxID=1314807 RepID=A0A4S8ML89_DENBC|nr:vacuolar amino acid permease [Dendrothele bispora CBS 962.96]
MAVDSRSSSPEGRPLLSELQPSYSATISSDTSTLAESDENADPPPLNNFSRLDTCWILAGLWSAVFLGALDGTVVATLLAPIGSDFNKSHQSSYIGTSYLLSVCCFTPLYGRLSDILGRKGAMLLALSLFGSGTLLCGFAPSMEFLIAARALAGMGGGGIVVTDLIPLKQRGLYQGMANILYGLGAGIGGPLGGWINDNFGCICLTASQAPVLLFSFVLVSLKVNIVLPDEVQNQTLRDKLRRIDFLGSLTLVGAVGCLLLGFSLKTTEEMPWSHPWIYGLFTASLLFGITFLLVEKSWSPYPVMPLGLITQRTPLAVSMSNLFGSMAAFSMVFFLYHRYFSAVRLYSATDAGAHLLPHSIAISVGSVFAGWVMRRTGKLYNLTIASSLLANFASLLVVFWNNNTTAFHLWFDIVPQGFGMASLITSTLIAMIAGVQKQDMAVATGITYLFRTTGQVLGVALSGAILQAILLQKLRSRIQGPAEVTHRNDSVIISFLYRTNANSSPLFLSHSTEIIPTLNPEQRAAAINSYADALRVVFISQAVWNFLSLLWSLLIQENVLPYVFENFVISSF